MPFNVACGRCKNCETGKTACGPIFHPTFETLAYFSSISFCTIANPGFAGSAYGYVAMGPYKGGQAQYIR